MKGTKMERSEAMNVECLTLTVTEAGKVVGLGRNAAYAAARRGEIPTIRIGRRILVPKAGLKKLLNGEG